MFSKKDYTYHLPEELIAQEAVHPHHNARIIIIDRESGTIDAEDIFWNLDAHLDKRRVFFFNNSKVLRSRIPLKNAPIQRIDGSTGMISSGEIFFLKNRDNAEFEALVHPGNKFKIGTKIFIGDSIITVVQKTDS
jgi:S-adenosylmethionine:tRNA ribosyltransferase-isomerase